MKAINGIKFTTLLTGILGVSLPSFACPDMQGSYLVEQGKTQLYVQKKGTETYQVVLDIPTYPLMMKTATLVSEKDQKANTYQTPLPDCTLKIADFGYLIPYKNGSVYNLHFDSQDFQKVFKTDFVLKLSDTPDGVMGVNKTGSSLPAKAIDAFGKK